ncbi:MAG: tyrosine-type recombinase/integrase [Reyranellaceae bacterium]
MRRKITDALVTRLAAPEAGRVEVSDTITTGFGLRVTAQGTRTFHVVYRVKGDRRLRRMTLGDAKVVGLADARAAAKAAIELALTGADPAVRRKAEAAEERALDQETEAGTVAKVAEKYIERHAKPNLRTWRQVERTMQKHVVSAWGSRQVHSVARKDVIALLDKISAETPIMANRVHALLSRFFGWCIERDLIASSPMAGLKKPAKERSRDRVLMPAELRAVWKAADAIGYPGGPLVKLLMLTGCRLSEIANLTKAQIGTDMLTLPETKNGRPCLVPLTRAAKEVLDALPKFEGPHVLTSTAGKRPISNFSDIKTALDDECQIDGWVMHDLRRTAASGMAELGIAPHVIEAVLNHQTGAVSGIARVYNRFDYAAEKRVALERWAAEVRRVVAAKARPSKVVELRA